MKAYKRMYSNERPTLALIVNAGPDNGEPPEAAVVLEVADFRVEMSLEEWDEGVEHIRRRREVEGF